MTVLFNGKPLDVLASSDTQSPTLILRINGLSMIERALVNGKINAKGSGRIVIDGPRLILDTSSAPSAGK
jgi:hypothetical protein